MDYPYFSFSMIGWEVRVRVRCALMLESILEVFQAVERLQTQLLFWKALVTNPRTLARQAPPLGATCWLGLWMCIGQHLQPLSDPQGEQYTVHHTIH